MKFPDFSLTLKKFIFPDLQQPCNMERSLIEDRLGHFVVLWNKTLLFHSASLQRGVCLDISEPWEKTKGRFAKKKQPMNETIRITSSYGKIVIHDLQLELEGERKGGYSTVIRLYYVPEINGIQSLFGVGMFTQFAHVFQSKRP